MNRAVSYRLGILAAALPLFAACNSSSLASRGASVEVSPSTLDFGRVLAGTTTAGTITVSNVGGKTLTVSSWAFAPLDARLEVIGVSPAVTLPFTLEPGAHVRVDVRFQPPEPGAALSDFVVSTDDATQPDAKAIVSGTGYLDQNDVLEQGTQHSADILFVVDNSGSMSDKQQRLSDSFSTFINWLIGHTVSFHIAVTTTDMDDPNQSGAFFSAPGVPKILKNDTPNLVAAFNSNVHVGTSGSASERGLDGAVSALTYPLIATTNVNFLRDDAQLYLVFVSDENDQSAQSVGYYVELLTTVKDGNPNNIYFAAIAGDSPSGCSSVGGSATAGTRYHDVVNQSGGLWGSICDADFGVTLQNLAFAITEPTAQFFLAYVPDTATIKVFVDGVQEPGSHWSYQEASNSVLFDAAFVPAMGTQVEIKYVAIGT